MRRFIIFEKHGQDWRIKGKSWIYLRLGERVLKGTLEELGRDWRTEEFVIKDIAIV